MWGDLGDAGRDFLIGEQNKDRGKSMYRKSLQGEMRPKLLDNKIRERSMTDEINRSTEPNE